MPEAEAVDGTKIEDMLFSMLETDRVEPEMEAAGPSRQADTKLHDLQA